VAANAFLEGLARRRRVEGLPALAVGFGAISDAGYLARNAGVNQALSQRLGRSALSAAEALEGLEALLRCDPRDVKNAVFNFARVDWSLARKELGIIKTPLFDELQLDEASSEGAALAAGELLSQLRELPDVEVQARVADMIAESITRTLRLPSGDIDRNRALSEFGMDSLMMLELRMAVEEKMGIEIPLMSLTASLTIVEISRRLTTMLRSKDKAIMPGQVSVLAQEHIDIPANLSETEVAATVAAVSRRAKAVDRIL
jgi:acyl carrier protein